MGILHLVGGEKGGVGKSFTARLLAQYIIDQNQSLFAFDSDQSNATFSRFYGEFSLPLNVDDIDSLDQILDIAEKEPQANIIVDLAAQTFSKLDNWINESDLFGIMDELGFRVFYWHVMDHGVDSMHLLDNILKTYVDTNFELIVVENYGRGKSFSNFEQSNTYSQAVQNGAKLFTLANLHEGLSHKIDFKNFSFWAAANNSEYMSLAERRRTQTWMKFSYEQIDKLLLPQAEASENLEEIELNSEI